MAKEICISSTPHETRLAILEDDQLAEIYYERENEYTLAGSIYNGRVTRVLPGMQSAFVDIGLERDAFLYVSDFLELEDQEESDEVEKASITGKSPIHEVRRAASPQPEEQGNRNRPQRERRPVVSEVEEETTSVGETQATSEESQDETSATGARRWRGRRRRRGGRNVATEDVAETQESREPQASGNTIVLSNEEEFDTTEVEPIASVPERADRERSAPHARSASAHMPTRVLLPGESLSKFGGHPAEPESKETETPAQKKTARPAVTSKPSTLVESPVEWDGTGLLPGESLSKHRNRIPEPEVEFETEETELDRAASHNVDPLPPTGFRLFGFGRKKKDEEKPKSDTPASTYAPGAGHLEEETIDGDEFVAKPKRGKRKDVAADYDDLEEEMLQAGPNRRTAEGEDEEASPAGGSQRRERHQRNRRGRSGPDSRSGQGNRRNMSRRSAQTTALPIISDLLKPGQEILVQIAKEPIAMKGARITSHIALPGRFLVFMPTVSHLGVSRKIASDTERQRLKRILVSERGESSGGFIVRTAAEGVSEEELRADLRFLMHLWDEIKNRSEGSKSPALIYHDLSLIERILRDQVSTNFSSIWVDSEADYERIVRFLNRFAPSMVRRVKMYTKEVPLFEHFGIQDEISKALRSKVWLKSGGSIVINQTEALVAIDINTGKYVGKSARLEDTILKTNLDAVPEIVRQMRLRDLGGIIVIDFIDMDERKNRFKVMAALEEALKSDRAPTKVLQFNDFGLVAITRKRVKQSLERTLSVPCPTCQATGMVKSSMTVCNEIYVELRKMKRHFDGKDVMLRVHPETVKVLKANNGNWISEFEGLLGKNVLIKSDPTLHPEQFDIQG